MQDIDLMKLGNEIGRLANAVEHLTSGVARLESRLSAVEQANEITKQTAAWQRGAIYVAGFVLMAIGAMAKTAWEWLTKTP